MVPLLTGIKTMAMEGSSSEQSYANNSSYQSRIFHALGKPLLEKAIQQLLCNIAARTVESTCGRKHIAVADFGCSYGRNTLDCVDVIVGALQRCWAEGMTCPSSTTGADKVPEIQYFFADLPSNDFNSLFQSLHHSARCDGVVAAPSVDGNLPRIYAAGVPGSFHGRLLPLASLDLAICIYSLHWLSQVPPSVLDKSSSAWNGGQPWVHCAPQATVDAYTLQSHIDVSKFLKSRAQELASGGIFFLLLGSSASGSKSGSVDDDHASRWGAFNAAWKELVKEGIITLEELDTFNMPMYSFNEHQLKDMLENVLDFKLLHIQTIEENDNEVKFSLKQWSEAIVSATKPTVETHLGKEKSEELFKRFNNIASKNHGLMVAHNILVASLQRL